MNVSYHALRVLRQFLVRPDPQCGAEVMRELKIGPGTLYPMLARLKAKGWIRLTATLQAPNEPPAHFYEITEAGHVAFLEMLLRLTISDDLWKVPRVKNEAFPP